MAYLTVENGLDTFQAPPEFICADGNSIGYASPTQQLLNTHADLPATRHAPMTSRTKDLHGRF